MHWTMALRFVRLICAAGFTVVLGAAAPGMPVELSDVGPLGQTAAPPASAVPGLLNTVYQAAPMPDEDAQAPAGFVPAEAQLSPRLISPKTLIQGDGFSNGSSQQSAVSDRQAAAAGLGLSVPVK